MGTEEYQQWFSCIQFLREVLWGQVPFHNCSYSFSLHSLIGYGWDGSPLRHLSPEAPARVALPNSTWQEFSSGPRESGWSGLISRVNRNQRQLWIMKILSPKPWFLIILNSGHSRSSKGEFEYPNRPSSHPPSECLSVLRASYARIKKPKLPLYNIPSSGAALPQGFAVDLDHSSFSWALANKIVHTVC